MGAKPCHVPPGATVAWCDPRDNLVPAGMPLVEPPLRQMVVVIVVGVTSGLSAPGVQEHLEMVPASAMIPQRNSR